MSYICYMKLKNYIMQIQGYRNSKKDLRTFLSMMYCHLHVDTYKLEDSMRDYFKNITKVSEKDMREQFDKGCVIISLEKQKRKHKCWGEGSESGSSH